MTSTGVSRFAPDGTRLHCTVPDCTAPVLARELCSRHYQRQLAGKPLDAERDQWGERNPTWIGDQAGYAALHTRVHRRRGMPKRCERCGTQDPSKTYEWANLTGNYQDPDDYERMCKSCHNRYDASRRPRRPIQHGTNAGWMRHTKAKERPCEPCRVARNLAAAEWRRIRTTKRAQIASAVPEAAKQGRHEPRPPRPAQRQPEAEPPPLTPPAARKAPTRKPHHIRDGRCSCGSPVSGRARWGNDWGGACDRAEERVANYLQRVGALT